MLRLDGAPQPTSANTAPRESNLAPMIHLRFVAAARATAVPRANSAPPGCGDPAALRTPTIGLVPPGVGSPGRGDSSTPDAPRPCGMIRVFAAEAGYASCSAPRIDGRGIRTLHGGNRAARSTRQTAHGQPAQGPHRSGAGT